MVKTRKKNSKKRRSSKGFLANAAKARRINASTEFGTCTEQLSPFGGLLSTIKFLDLLKFEDIFNFAYQAPSRKPRLGHYLMVVGYVNQIRMAEIAGIGVIGKNGLLLYSKHGSRLMLGGLLTSASLPVIRYPDSEEPGCPSDCQICSDACPVNAIMPERKQVKIMRCLSHTSRTPAMSRIKFLYLRAINKKAAARYMSITSFDEHTFHICSKCVSLCPYGNKK